MWLNTFSGLLNRFWFYPHQRFQILSPPKNSIFQQQDISIQAHIWMYSYVRRCFVECFEIDILWVLLNERGRERVISWFWMPVHFKWCAKERIRKRFSSKSLSSIWVYDRLTWKISFEQITRDHTNACYLIPQFQYIRNLSLTNSWYLSRERSTESRNHFILTQHCSDSLELKLYYRIVWKTPISSVLVFWFFWPDLG